MTDVAPTRPSTPPARAQASVGATLAKIEAAYVAAPNPYGPAYWQVRNLPDSQSSPRERWRDAKHVMRSAPTLEEIDAFLGAAREILEAKPDQAKTITMVGILLSAFPAGRPADFDAYADTLVYDIGAEGYGPALVARACKAIRRKAKFLPTSAEMLEACAAERDALNSGVYTAEQYRKRIEAASALAGQPEPALTPYEERLLEQQAENDAWYAKRRAGPAAREGSDGSAP